MSVDRGSSDVHAEDGARVLDHLRNPLLARRRLTDDDRDALAQFLSFQLVRGARKRREIELIADWQLKVTAGAHGYEGTLDELARLRIVPHPNEHLGQLGGLAEQAYRYIRPRPVCVVELDRPLLFTCDEPVLVLGDEADDGQSTVIMSTARTVSRASDAVSGPPDAVSVTISARLR